MNWIYSATDPLLQTLAGSLIIFLLIILITRIIGLRSFAKFTVYDFAITVAIGSIISSILTSSTTIAHGFIAIAALLTLTYLFSALQRKFSSLYSAITNKPVVLMEGRDIKQANLKSARIHEDQLIAKLREANVLNFDQVIAVVLETTGDISVLHRSSTEEDEFEERLLQGVSDRGR
mgnify:FL=1